MKPFIDIIKLIFKIPELIFFSIYFAFFKDKYDSFSEWVICEALLMLDEYKNISKNCVNLSLEYLKKPEIKFNLAKILRDLKVKANENNKVQFKLKSQSLWVGGSPKIQVNIIFLEIEVNSYKTSPNIFDKYKLTFPYTHDLCISITKFT